MKRWLPLVIILLLFGLLVSLEISWGLPGPQRSRFLFPNGPEAELLQAIVDRTARRVSSQSDRPFALWQREQPPAYDLGEALDAERRFLLYTDHPDEMLTIIGLSRMKPSQLQFDPGQGQYGGAYFYPLGAWLKAAAATGLVKQGSLADYLRRPQDLGRVYVAGRAFVALAVAGAILVLYLIGLRLGGAVSATVAAGLLAFCPAALNWSVVLKPHAVAMLPAALALYWSLAWFDRPRRRSIILAAAAAGLAVGMTMVALPILMTVLLALWLRRREPERGRTERDRRRIAGDPAQSAAEPAPPMSRLGGTVLLLAVAAGVFFITNPYTLTNFGARLAEARQVQEFYAGGSSLLAPLQYLNGPLREGFGLVFILLAVMSLVVLMFHEARRAMLLVAPLAFVFFILPYTLGPWAGDPTWCRFALPMLPLLAVAIAWAVGAWAPQLRLAPLGLPIIMLALGLPVVYACHESSRGVNPRYAAAEWLKQFPQTPLLVDYPPAPWRTPPLDFVQRRIIYQPVAEPYISIACTWNPPAGADDERRRVFKLSDRPAWLRAPLSFADWSLVLELHNAPQ